MLLGLGWPEWLLIIGLLGGLILTFAVMAKAAVAYQKARERREATSEVVERTADEGGDPS
ncbi:MAG TPA: hypothetical protein VNC78_09555 [Actinomycetota bacterium]|nr:hypothetical protein [Actinomycetota bacterium]